MKRLAFWHEIVQRPFVRRVGVLVGGTAIGQLFAILTLPILTRLYGPEAFSVLAVYTSTLSLLSAIACLRLEIAIPLPRHDLQAAALCVLALLSTIVISLLTALIVYGTPFLFNKATDNKIEEFLWLIPLGVLAIGLYNSLQYWSTRHKQFSLISKTRVSQSLTGTSVKLGSGYLLDGWTAGLIFGQLLTQGAGFISLASSLIKNDLSIFKRLRLKHLIASFKRYDKFPKYSTLEAFANTGGIQIPIIIIAYYAAGPEAGYLMIAMQLLSAPMSLIGSAVAQVYLAEGAGKYHSGELKKLTYKTILNLAKISFVPLLLVGLLAPILMPYFLGNEWKRTGILISWMAPWFFMQFITSPVSMALHITSNQKTALNLQLVGIIFRVGCVLFVAVYYDALLGEVYALTGTVFYLVYFLAILFKINRL